MPSAPVRYMLRDSHLDPDEATSYIDLDKLLEGKLDKVLNLSVRTRYLNGIESVMTALPPGEARQTVLRALSTGVSASLRRYELVEVNEVLATRLSSEMPEAKGLLDLTQKVGVYLDILLRKFRETCEAEKKRGVDMSKSTLHWYEHELYTFVPAIRNALSAINKLGIPSAAPATTPVSRTVDEGPDAPTGGTPT